MVKSLKIRLYPSKKQEELMWRHIHASRFIYNYMLALQNARYEAGQKHLSAFDMNKLLNIELATKEGVAKGGKEDARTKI